MGRYAGGNYAIALCDRCGLQYRNNSLKKEWNGLRTCVECWEPKHPQIQPIFPPTEPQALFEPRPSRVEPMQVPVGQEIFPYLDNISTQGVTQIGMVSVEIT